MRKILEIPDALNSELPTREEISYLLRGGKERRSCVREGAVWSAELRQAKLAFIKHENHGGCFPRDGDGSYWLDGSDLA